jgi:rfaE bifunctional protein nucleotidyltransferase chain/domain
MRNPADKIVHRDRLAKITAELREEGKRVVLTNGCFDLLHVGHSRYLYRARQLGDCLIVALNSDESIRRIKGHQRPILPQAERAEIMASLESVDYVTIFEEDIPRSIVLQLRPHILVKGGDWGEDNIIGREEVLADGGRIERIPYIEGSSTTSIIEKILAVHRKSEK